MPAFLPPFDYDGLETDVVSGIQQRAERILMYTRYGKKSLNDMIAIGADLLATEFELGKRFHQWRRVIVGYARKTAKGYMAVAKWLAAQADIMSPLPITPTAARLLVSPSVPEQAGEEALRRARRGDRITVAVAEDIIVTARRHLGIAVDGPANVRLCHRLEKTLDECGQRCHTEKFYRLADAIRDHVGSILMPKDGEALAVVIDGDETPDNVIWSQDRDYTDITDRCCIFRGPGVCVDRDVWRAENELQTPQVGGESSPLDPGNPDTLED